MKEENQPIKLECFMHLNDTHREQIGFVLLPMRSIPFWNGRKMGMMKPHWYKLHGVSQESSRSNKPELLLSVTIGDKDEILNDTEQIVGFCFAWNNKEEKCDNILTTKYACFLVKLPSENQQPDKSEETIANISNLKSNSDLFIQRLSENEIHLVGIENNDQNEFSVTIELSKIDGAENFNEKVNLVYTLFDKHQCELTKSSGNGQFSIDKILNIKINASYSDLIAYFQHIFTLAVNLTTINENDRILGRKKSRFGSTYHRNHAE